jgi:hypothetical protein
MFPCASALADDFRTLWKDFLMKSRPPAVEGLVELLWPASFRRTGKSRRGTPEGTHQAKTRALLPIIGSFVRVGAFRPTAVTSSRPGCAHDTRHSIASASPM